MDGLENQRLADVGLKTALKILEILELEFAITTLGRRRPTLDELQRENEIEDEQTRLARRR